MPISLKPQGILIILSSPSGGGKSSICKALLSADPRLGYSVSTTSRPRRGHEVDGRDYYFVAEDEFHKQIAQYNQLGIAVDYVLFPLSIHPGADKKAQTVWCSKDRNVAYNEAMDGKALSPLTCSNPIAEITNTANAIGINGTPAIFDDDGAQLGGYVPPAQLAKQLQDLAQRKSAP